MEAKKQELPTLEELLRTRVIGGYYERVFNLPDHDAAPNITYLLKNLDDPNKRHPIPEEHLIVLEKVYHRIYPNPGRSRGSLIRIIRNYSKYEPDLKVEKLYNHLMRKPI